MLPRYLQGRILKTQGNYHRSYLLIFDPRLTRGSREVGGSQAYPVSFDTHEPEMIMGHHS